MGKRFVCIHGHFYQPPRENPWLEAIETQASAAPFHDWNARIQAECYAPNGACRIRKDFVGPVVDIVNNYKKLSFNFGPTLLSWMEKEDPRSYQRILDADRDSVEMYSGHGNAMAQAHNHMIMPLASEHDRKTQVQWGIVDFIHRFGRKPEGMWLPETAVDVPTLRSLAEAGIRFTVLAPGQALAVRKLSAGRRAGKVSKRLPKWNDVSGGRVDPTKAYWCDLGDGLGIDLFFYDGPISGAVAFEGLLNDGRYLGERLMGALRDHKEPQLIHIATDGETYGHHHRHGDMALATALEMFTSSDDIEITNYGEFLERFPPKEEVKIVEPSAWSCAHGVGRWSRDCGCNAGTEGYNQAWRGPLREALDYLKEGLDELFFQAGRSVLKDPERARNQYLWVLLKDQPEFRERFLLEHAVQNISADHVHIVWRLLEMQRHGMLMYTSCGWFFDEVSGIEGIQILRYAARALELAESLGAPFREGFLRKLEATPSNVPEIQNARVAFERYVMPSQIHPDRILARHAIGAVLDSPPETSQIFCYQLEQADFQQESFGATSIGVGRVKLFSETTQEEEWAAFAVLHFGEHDFCCKIHRFESIGEYDRAKKAVLDAFRRHALKDTILAMESGFPGSDHDIRDLFSEERQRLVRRVLADSLESLSDSYQRIYKENRKLMGFPSSVGIPLPEELAIVARYVLVKRLEVCAQELADRSTRLELSALLKSIEELLAELKQLGLEIDQNPLRVAIQNRLEEESHALAFGEGHDVEVCVWLIQIIQNWKIEMPLWRVQNDVFRYLKGPVRSLRQDLGAKDAGQTIAFEAALKLGQMLGFEVEG